MTVCIATVGADISQRSECSRGVIKDILRCGSDVCFPQGERTATAKAKIKYR
jgi:hypothetical protein